MINAELSKLLPIIRKYLATQPILRAWIFGSCSRGEETPASDLDILVSYDYDQKISLLTVGRIITDLEKLVNRQVDLVSEQGLMDFARPTAMHDRILIYERDSQR